MKWDEWRGTLDNKPVMWIKRILEYKGWRVDVHKMVGADLPECFHTHPAKAFRLILWGGYTEEMEDRTTRLWFPLRFGIVVPKLSHRISKLSFKVSYSLWIIWPKTDKVLLNGSGWSDNLRNK